MVVLYDVLRFYVCEFDFVKMFVYGCCVGLLLVDFCYGGSAIVGGEWLVCFAGLLFDLFVLCCAVFSLLFCACGGLCLILLFCLIGNSVALLGFYSYLLLDVCRDYGCLLFLAVWGVCG